MLTGDDSDCGFARLEMIVLVLFLSGIHRYELAHLMGSWLILEREGSKGPYRRYGPQMTGASDTFNPQVKMSHKHMTGCLE